MSRYHWQRALRVTQLSEFEGCSSLAGVVLIVVGAVAALVASEKGALPRAIGLAGLVAIATSATSGGARLYRAGVTASLPTSVGRMHVRIRPARGFGVSTMALAVALPLAVTVTALVLVEWRGSWSPVSCCWAAAR
jgi:hypothetical protein